MPADSLCRYDYVKTEVHCNRGYSSLLYLLYAQDEEEVVVQTPEITQRVHHATDEEKLASTCAMGQTTDSQEEREELECKKAPVKKQPSVIDGKFNIDVGADMILRSRLSNGRTLGKKMSRTVWNNR